MSKFILVENCAQRRRICRLIAYCPYNTTITTSEPMESGIHPDCPLTDFPDVEKMVEDEAVKFLVFATKGTTEEEARFYFDKYQQSKKEAK